MAGDYEIADSLLALRTQLDVAYPLRSRKSDGMVGDASHKERDSDHNPWWQHGTTWYVTASDTTHDPQNGVDCNWLAYRLRSSEDKRIKYVIWDKRIMSGAKGPSPWVWRKYNGPNLHTKHLHLSVMPEPVSLTSTRWNLGPELGPHLTPKDDDLPNVDDVWAKKVWDLYTATPGDTLSAGDSLAWATRHAALALDEIRACRAEQQELRALVRSLANKLGVTP